MIAQPPFLPATGEEMRVLGWNALDILLVSGDAHVDHPAFGIALLGRFLVSRGYRVGVVAQPRWQNPDEAAADLGRMGRPRLLAGVSAGAVDSMLARYTAFRKMRSDDAYTPGGLAGKRPNRAVLVYCGLLRRVFPDLPVLIGGLEASLRRVSHYDFWSDSLRRSLLLDSKADLLLYGMAETALAACALAAEKARSSAVPGAVCRTFQALARTIPGTSSAISAKEAATIPGALRLPSHEDILADRTLLMAATLAMERQTHQGRDPAVQISGERAVLVNPPAPPLSAEELDGLYGLPFSRLPHPAHTQPVPAWEMIRTSITSHRGCAGGCAFCSLALHQTRRIASRSSGSILAEAGIIAAGPPRGEKKAPPAWAGAISDVGGPSANMWRAACALNPARCERQSCLFPAPCPGFRVDQTEGAQLLREVARQPGVRHVRVASGVRFDLALRDDAALAAYTREFTGGQLKIAPEHISETVLRLMRKPPPAVFERFLERFARLSQAAGKEQYVVPYLMSAHPGCTDEDMRELAAWLRRRNWRPQQVQCFIPTPGTVATAMFYAGTDTDMRPIPVARTDAARMRQHYILAGRGAPDDVRAVRANGAAAGTSGGRFAGNGRAGPPAAEQARLGNPAPAKDSGPERKSGVHRNTPEAVRNGRGRKRGAGSR